MLRIFCVFLSLAILICPYWCNVVGCQVLLCKDTAPEEHGQSCCQSVSDDRPSSDGCDSHQKRHRPPPDRRPCEQSCQCICGGAVIVSSDLKEIARDSTSHSIADIPDSALASQWERVPHTGDIWRGAAAKSGRMMRTEMMSFLC